MGLNALQKITYGLYVVGCYADGRPVGCIINTCFQVTSENPVLAISLNKNNFTLEAIKKNPRLCLSIIAEDTDPSIIGKFGFYSGRDTDKYSDFGYTDLDGTPAVNGRFCGRLILDAFNFVDCGTHMLVLGRLVTSHNGEGRPMTYAYYHEVIKGSAPKNAPTYQKETIQETPQKSSRTYKCDICGYTVESADGLPDDYVCPICGADRSHFMEI